MKILIETIETAAQAQEAAWIRSEVFGREWNCCISHPMTSEARRAIHLLARACPGRDAIAALSVVETSGDFPLHSGFGISFPENATIARYTQLAVLKPWRGLRVAVRMMREAQFLCAGAYRFDYTWLLFNAARARSSVLCTDLGFQASE